MKEWWRASDRPELMLQFLLGKVSDRKLRLFAVACCRRCWPLFVDDRSQRSVLVAERFADGRVSIEELSLARPEAAEVSKKKEPYIAAFHVASDVAADAASEVAVYLAVFVARDPNEERAAQAVLVREIFGNSFRPAPIHSSCITGTVTALARTIYDDRAFDRMPILADALEEAGCDNAEILQHWCEPGVHVRGCWVVDLLLDKK